MHVQAASAPSACKRDETSSRRAVLLFNQEQTCLRNALQPETVSEQIRECNAR